MKTEPKKFDDDDGRVLCNMDVEGMSQGMSWRLPWPNRRLRRPPGAAQNAMPGEPMTRSEAWLYTWYSVLAGLLVVAVFAVSWVLFILFCTQIWLR